MKQHSDINIVSSDLIAESNLFSILVAGIPFYASNWKEAYGTLLSDQHLRKLASRIIKHLIEGDAFDQLPCFEEEVKPAYTEIINYFKPFVDYMNEATDQDEIVRIWANAIENAPFHYLLTLMGQRFTPASARDASALPPNSETLLTSCLAPYNEQVSVATRAWEKHIGRSEDDFWGEIKGNALEKNEKVQALISKMMSKKTWWNVFHHYKHGLVYEIRMASGHGLRWNRTGTVFIGFLEPFLESSDE